jgi:hypothetical protein
MNNLLPYIHGKAGQEIKMGALLGAYFKFTTTKIVLIQLVIV